MPNFVSRLGSGICVVGQSGSGVWVPFYSNEGQGLFSTIGREHLGLVAILKPSTPDLCLGGLESLHNQSTRTFCQESRVLLGRLPPALQ